MSIKLGAMLLLLLIYAYKLFLSYIERKSFDNPIPEMSPTSTTAKPT